MHPRTLASLNLGGQFDLASGTLQLSQLDGHVDEYGVDHFDNTMVATMVTMAHGHDDHDEGVSTW